MTEEDEERRRRLMETAEVLQAEVEASRARELESWEVPIDAVLQDLAAIEPPIRGACSLRVIVRPSFRATVAYGWITRRDQLDVVRRVIVDPHTQVAEAKRGRRGSFWYARPDGMEVADAELPAPTTALLDELRNAQVPLTCDGPRGTDGTTTEVWLGEIFHNVVLRYWGSGPPAWAPVLGIVDRARVAFEAALTRPEIGDDEDTLR